MNYIFSWYCTENHPRLIPRPWWAFWRHDELVLDTVQVRKAITLTELEGELVQNPEPAVASLLKKLMGREVQYVQLEHATLDTPYVSSAYISTSGATESLAGARRVKNELWKEWWK
jgi:hypothetical protein